MLEPSDYNLLDKDDEDVVKYFKLVELLKEYKNIEEELKKNGLKNIDLDRLEYLYSQLDDLMI